MNNKYMLYYVLGAMAIYVIFWKIIPFLRKAKKVTKGLLSKIYLNKNSDISVEQYRKLLTGAIYSEHQTAYINSLTTGLAKSEIRTLLSGWWGINNKDEAFDTLEYLSNKGFRFYFPHVFSAFQVQDVQQQQDIISDLANEEACEAEDIPKAYGQLQNLKETWDELKECKVLQTTDELNFYGNIGWDCGRLTYVARMCYDAGYITEEEAWKYIDNSYQLASKTFKDWNDFAKSYAIGRAMWGGKTSHNSVIIDIGNYLLKEEKSPWKSISLRNQ